MSASFQCPHTNFKPAWTGEQFFDSNIRIFRHRVACAACGQVFRAIGVRDGVSIDAPCTPDDGETIVLAMVPANEEPDMTTREMLAS
jgi:hypothetical protein